MNFIAPQQKPTVTGAIAQTVNSRLLSSRLGRGTISAAISLAVLAVAAFILYALLRDADFGKVVATLKAQSIGKIGIAAAFVIAGYVTLTFYDYFALHAIGRHKVPYAIAALASFTSFTIGHSLGAAVLTGGLIRLRIYSVWGLTVLDIAKIAFITSMTFWLGNALLLGGAITYAPEAAAAVDHLPLWINRAIGLSGLFAIACYLLWLAPRPRAVGRAGWRIVLPNLRFTLLQIGIGALDLALISLAMYMPAAAQSLDRVRDPAGHFPHSHALGDGQPCARRPRRHRGHHAGRPCAIPARRAFGSVIDVSCALFRLAGVVGHTFTRLAGTLPAGAPRRRQTRSWCVREPRTL